MSIRAALRRVTLCLCLQIAVFSGAAIDPKEIEELLHTFNRAQIVHVLPKEDPEDDEKP